MPSQLSFLLEDPDSKQNLRALARFALALAASIGIFTVLFHTIMVYEGQQHSWLTGLYWTLTVMSTLGFGDITFQSDMGRGFTIFVLVYGIVMLLIVAPFTFIRFFYAPWLEAQIRAKAPTACPRHMTGHVVVCAYDELTRALVRRLEEFDIPYVVIEPDLARAAHLHGEGLEVVAGPRDEARTFERVKVAEARLVFANLSDTQNTNVTLTVREISPKVPIVALAENVDSIDVLQLAGATEVLPLKQRLGEQLATRVTDGIQSAQRIGAFGDLVIAEFPIHGTALPGRSVRESRLRELTGLSIVAVWEKGRLLPAGADTVLSEHSVPVVVGTEEQLTELDALFVIYQVTDSPVLVIGGGKVGQAVARAMHERDVPVTILDEDETLRHQLAQVADRVVIGDAAHLETVKEAGIDEVRSVVLTTNDDATNLFLAIYCRKLSDQAHIISRISHDRNLTAIHRAGADFALSHGSLAIQTLIALVRGRDLIVLGEGAELFTEPTPAVLVGKPLAESGIGARTGLTVVAIREAGRFRPNPTAATELAAGTELVMIGTAEQRKSFQQIAGAG
jgi:Trk K+ transport system NAD-binding subunit